MPSDRTPAREIEDNLRADTETAAKAVQLAGMDGLEVEEKVHPPVRSAVRPVLQRLQALARSAVATMGAAEIHYLTLAGHALTRLLENSPGGWVSARLELWSVLRRRPDNLPARSFGILVSAWNAAQAGRGKAWRIEAEEDFERIFLDRTFDPATGRFEILPLADRTAQVPAAHLVRMAGFRLVGES